MNKLDVYRLSPSLWKEPTVELSTVGVLHMDALLYHVLSEFCLVAIWVTFKWDEQCLTFS